MVEGEALDAVQSLIGLSAEGDYGNRINIPDSQSKVSAFIEKRSPGYKAVRSAIKHTIGKTTELLNKLLEK